MKKNMKDVALKLLSRIALDTAKREADSACFCIGYQPEMPKEVKELRKRKL